MTCAASAAREHDWRQVREWLDPRYGYGVFPGPCPILTNHAMVLVALCCSAATTSAGR